MPWEPPRALTKGLVFSSMSQNWNWMIYFHLQTGEHLKWIYYPDIVPEDLYSGYFRINSRLWEILSLYLLQTSFGCCIKYKTVSIAGCLSIERYSNQIQTHLSTKLWCLDFLIIFSENKQISVYLEAPAYALRALSLVSTVIIIDNFEVSSVFHVPEDPDFFFF